MNPHQILFFADRLPPLIGGMEVHAQYFIQYFSQCAQFPLIATITKNAAEEDCIVEHGRLDVIDLYDTSLDLNPQILFFNSGRWVESLAALCQRFPRAKCIYRTGGNEILKAPLTQHHLADHRMRQQYWVDALNQHIDCLITNSAYTEARLRALGITTMFKRFVGGVCAFAWHNLERQVPDLLTIFCAARFVPYKNHALMIRLIQELLSRGHRFKTRLAGDGPLQLEMHQRVQREGLEHAIDFLGALDHQDTLQEMCNADLYMQLSQDTLTEVPGGRYLHSEGMGRSILEAITSGTFVIIGDSGALSEVVTPDSGILLTMTDVKTMADTIEPFIQRPPPKRKIQTQWDWSNIFQGYETLFSGL